MTAFAPSLVWRFLYLRFLEVFFACGLVYLLSEGGFESSPGDFDRCGGECIFTIDPVGESST